MCPPLEKIKRLSCKKSGFWDRWITVRDLQILQEEVDIWKIEA
uniref:Clathrin interactor EPSIN 1 isoform X1 n=1 Tax=Rhizophora mucronata TaxID=61149 RepID=A0A2P2L1P3_RHIMU